MKFRINTVIEKITESGEGYQKLPSNMKKLIAERRLRIKKISRIQAMGERVNETDCFHKSYCNVQPAFNACMKSIFHDFSCRKLIMKLSMLCKEELDGYEKETNKARRFGYTWMLLPKNEYNVELVKEIQESWGYSSARKHRILDIAIWKLYEKIVRRGTEISFDQWIIEKTQEETNHRFYRCYICQNVNFK